MEEHQHGKMISVLVRCSVFHSIKHNGPIECSLFSIENFFLSECHPESAAAPHLQNVPRDYNQKQHLVNCVLWCNCL